jgi:site-specific DNA-methyltransferase (adenine-specific)
MMPDKFLKDKIALHCGDMRAILAELPDNIYDSCVTDPPYHLTSIVKRFAKENPEDVERNFVARKTDGQGLSPFHRAARGFMGKVWDGGDIAFDPDTWRAVYRVLKPGAHLLAFGGSRTYGRLQVAIEDAGFEVRDTIAWLYGSGFPKSHDVSKRLDRMAGVEREVIETYNARGFSDVSPTNDGRNQWAAGEVSDKKGYRTAPATDAARQWDGWGTALKPAIELICLARKPLSEATVAANVLKWGTGAINIDGCRVPHVTVSGGNLADNTHLRTAVKGGEDSWFKEATGERFTQPNNLGRWPANLAHDGSEEVLAGFPDTGISAGGRIGNKDGAFSNLGNTGFTTEHVAGDPGYGDSGSAARFFYTAKADSDDRLGSKHPTVKPLDLMQWLVRLVTPKGGLVLDPFAGTGTTGEAAWREGMRAELVEAETEYQADIRGRMELTLSGPDERARQSIKAKNLPRDDGPLFAPKESWSEMWARPFDYSKLAD